MHRGGECREATALVFWILCDEGIAGSIEPRPLSSRISADLTESVGIMCMYDAGTAFREGAG